MAEEIECPACFGYGFVKCCHDLKECYHGGDGLVECSLCGGETEEGSGGVDPGDWLAEHWDD